MKIDPGLKPITLPNTVEKRTDQPDGNCGDSGGHK